MSDLSAVLTKWAKPDPSLVGKLPRVTCRDCSDKRTNCTKHQKSKCNVCGAFISTAHIHLDFMGHAEVTRALIETDPEWTWEPAGWDDNGQPKTTTTNGMTTMWATLTVLGVTRHGVGSCESGKPDVYKELIGDFLRNAAMRFGIGLSLWSKSEWEDIHVEAPAPEPLASEGTVAMLSSALDATDPQRQLSFKAWWKAQRLPPLKSGQLTEAQAQAALDELERAPGPDGPEEAAPPAATPGTGTQPSPVSAARAALSQGGQR